MRTDGITPARTSSYVLLRPTLSMDAASVMVSKSFASSLPPTICVAMGIEFSALSLSKSDMCTSTVSSRDPPRVPLRSNAVRFFAGDQFHLCYPDGGTPSATSGLWISGAGGSVQQVQLPFMESWCWLCRSMASCCTCCTVEVSTLIQEPSALGPHEVRVIPAEERQVTNRTARRSGRRWVGGLAGHVR